MCASTTDSCLRYPEAVSEILRPGQWLGLKQRWPYRFRHVFNRLEALRLRVMVWLDGRPVYFAPDAAPCFGSLEADQMEDRWMMQRVLASLRTGDCFLDVGSHFGVYAIGAAHRVGSYGRVVAFEPTPQTVAKLTRNVELNRLQARVEIQQLALADREGSSRFLVAGTSMTNSISAGRRSGRPPLGSQQQEIMVATKRLDDFFDPHQRTVVKIDTEGAELAVLRGSRRLLESEAEIFLELHPWAWPSNDGWAEFQSLVHRCGRHIRRFDGTELREAQHCRVELLRA